ncbi:Ku protein [Granulicella sp. L46]|uniref:non-homologous end joining protein Ku n=1 Tax=Granulicella sp. L46 TaxID=1641865 RepID=UPI00131D49F8|nr:Ku protein [Granulicella sp. L46]
MARPYWSGKIQISLVSFGVKLFVATEAASDIHFHQIDRRTGERVRHQNVASSAIERNPDEAADPVHKSDIVKGYEYSHGRYVTIEPDELAHLRVPSKRTMDVAQFVDIDSIDPAFFEKPYFVVPEDDTQAEAFLTIRQALIDTNKIALSRIAFGGREHVIAIAPAPAHLSEKSTKSTKSTKSKSPKSDATAHLGLMAYTLRYAAELRDPAVYFESIKPHTINADSLALAKELIQRKTAAFDPTKFTDGYEAAVKELVDAKLKHAPIPREEPAPRSHGKVIHLMDALRKSVNDTKTSDTKTSATKRTDAAASKSASRKGPTLIKSATKSTPHREAKPTRTSPKRKTA